MKTYIIKGDPIALARPRFFQSRIFDSQKLHKAVAMLDLQEQHGDLPLFSGPVHLDITFYMIIPATVPKKKYPFVVGSPHVAKKDLDNLIKWIGDICNSVCWKDDRIVASVSAKKIYDPNPRTEFTIKNWAPINSNPISNDKKKEKQ